MEIEYDSLGVLWLVQVRVKVSFEVENEESFSDSGVEVTLPSDYANGLTVGGKRKVVAQLSKLYNIPKSYFTFEGYPRVVTPPAAEELPVLKVALQAVCSRNNGTIGVTPGDLAQVLSERGGYAEGDLIFLVAASGEKLRVAVEKLRHIQPEKARMFFFAVRTPAPPTQFLRALSSVAVANVLTLRCNCGRVQWRRTLADISSAAQAKRKEQAQAAAGEVRSLSSSALGLSIPHSSQEGRPLLRVFCCALSCSHRKRCSSLSA